MIHKERIGDFDMQWLDDGNGPPLLFVHGLPLDHTMWSNQIERFAKDRRVIAPDLRGFGGSGATASVTMEQLAGDLANLLYSLKITEPAVLIGLSMGGYLALQFAHRHQGRLRGLVLANMRSGADPPEMAEQRIKLADRVLAEGAQVIAGIMPDRLFGETSKQQRPELVARIRQVIAGNPPLGIAATLRAMATRPDLTPILPEIKLPTLVVAGPEDVISPMAEMQEIAAALPRGRFAVIPQAGHLSPCENPAAFNAVLAGFLAELPRYVDPQSE